MATTHTAARRIKTLTRTGTRFSHGAAWFFIATSIASLLWVIGSRIADPSGTTALYSTTFGDETWNALGLTYPGPVGLLWALAQLAVVGWATWQSVRGGIFKKTLAHGVLIGWAAFWAVNLLWLASMNPGIETFGQAAALIALGGATFIRAVTPYPKRIATDAEPAEAINDEPAAASAASSDEQEQRAHGWKQKLHDVFGKSCDAEPTGADEHDDESDAKFSARVFVVNPQEAARQARVALASARRHVAPACGSAAKQARECARRASRYLKKKQQEQISKAA